MDALGINLPGLVTQIVSFLVLFAILYLLLYKPLLRVMDQRSARIRESLSELWLEWGRTALNGGDRSMGRRLLERAESEARRALEIEPDQPWAHINLGLSLVEQHRLDGSADPGRLDEAIRHYESALSLAGDALRADRVRLVALHNTCDATIESTDQRNGSLMMI